MMLTFQTLSMTKQQTNLVLVNRSHHFEIKLKKYVQISGEISIKFALVSSSH